MQPSGTVQQHLWIELVSAYQRVKNISDFRRKKKNLSCNSDAFQELGCSRCERHVLFHTALGDGLVQQGPDLAQSTVVLATCHWTCIKWSWLTPPSACIWRGQPRKTRGPIRLAVAQLDCLGHTGMYVIRIMNCCVKAPGVILSPCTTF